MTANTTSDLVIAPSGLGDWNVTDEGDAPPQFLAAFATIDEALSQFPTARLIFPLAMPWPTKTGDARAVIAWAVQHWGARGRQFAALFADVKTESLINAAATAVVINDTVDEGLVALGRGVLDVDVEVWDRLVRASAAWGDLFALDLIQATNFAAATIRSLASEAVAVTFDDRAWPPRTTDRAGLNLANVIPAATWSRWARTLAFMNGRPGVGPADPAEGIDPDDREAVDFATRQAAARADAVRRYQEGVRVAIFARLALWEGYGDKGTVGIEAADFQAVMNDSRRSIGQAFAILPVNSELFAPVVSIQVVDDVVGIDVFVPAPYDWRSARFGYDRTTQGIAGARMIATFTARAAVIAERAERALSIVDVRYFVADAIVAARDWSRFDPRRADAIELIRDVLGLAYDPKAAYRSTANALVDTIGPNTGAALIA